MVSVRYAVAVSAALAAAASAHTIAESPATTSLKAEVHSYGEYNVRKCTETAARCAGAPGMPYIEYAQCCVSDLRCLEDKTLGWGRFCVKTDSYISEKCYKTNERCMGAEGHDYVDYYPCCGGGNCVKDDTLGWGYFCKGGKLEAKATEAKEYYYGEKATAAPVTPKSHYDHKYGYSGEDTVDNSGYYADYYYGKDKSGMSPTDPFAAFGRYFGCASPGAQLAAIDDLGPIQVTEVDVFVTIIIRSCSANINTFTDTDANLILSSLCASVKAIDASAKCAIYSIRPAPAAHMLIQESIRQITAAPTVTGAGVEITFQFRVGEDFGAAVVARLAAITGPAGGEVILALPTPDL
jgi:hypothetical protein